MGIDPFRAVAGQRRLGYDGTLKACERQRCIASNVPSAFAPGPDSPPFVLVDIYTHVKGFQSPEQDQMRRRLTSRCELADTEPYLQHFPGEMPLGFCLDCLDRSDLRLN